MESLNLSLRYSYADYLTWFDNIRRELFDGFVHAMAAPSLNHQSISGNLYRNFANYLWKNPCRVFYAPIDVRLPKNDAKENDKVFTVVQPDICVICDSSKLDEKGCLGAPDLIIEIISPTNSKRDVKDKYKIYEEAGVKEYWIVRPYDETVEIFLNENRKFAFNGIFAEDDLVPVTIFNGELIINLGEIFQK